MPSAAQPAPVRSFGKQWRTPLRRVFQVERGKHGEGSLRKRKDGRWEGRYTAGYDPATGKHIYKNVLGKTQAETKEKLRPSSHQTYRGYIDHHIKPYIGSIPLSKLTSLELQQLYKTLLTDGRVDRTENKKQPKGFSPKTVRNIHQIISSALKLAIEQRLIARNPTDACALPKLEHREMKTLPPEQLASFLREAKNSGVYEMYYMELATGLRRGELLGLKWEDIDL